MRLVSIQPLRGEYYHGLLYEPKIKGKVCCVFMHGTASNFYEEAWIHELANTLNTRYSVSLLTCNTSGSNGMNIYPKSGAVVEILENVVSDYNAWIEYLIRNGYTKIILIGHSLGTEKLVYYYNNTIYKNRIIGAVLAGFSDSYNYELEWLNSIHIKEKAFDEATQLQKSNRGYEILTTHENIHAGVLPQSADSFLNFFSPNSILTKCLNFSGSMEAYNNITIPMFGIISSGHEYTVESVASVVRKLEKNTMFKQCIMVNETNHDFESKEMEVSYHIGKFISSL